MKTRSFIAAGVTLAMSLSLGACTDSAPQPTPETISLSTEAGNQAETPAATTTTATTATATSPEQQAEQTGEDPVFAAIDAALAAYPGGIVVDVDREDGRHTYDIDLVLDNQVIELEVDVDGTVREDDREGDDDDVREARAATVSATEAIREALDRHPGGYLDEIELDEDDGRLYWEIELDDANFNDLAEIDIPAN
ncbi:hypothetical protein EAH68_11455 [Corynebacterium hylobatis]|uniref:PepSY domain-containing protein n=1 Tax=Corynebacterium hylobatis TaxID=1859290 RepID=A0A3S0AV52_9CORY|nr:PepSY domain-containing protein [Corynebacterium hylobatis]RSZ61692.1 hypothetical protein EAH68_11455 [Corynebacterium hylobatis]